MNKKLKWFGLFMLSVLTVACEFVASVYEFVPNDP